MDRQRSWFQVLHQPVPGTGISPIVSAERERAIPLIWSLLSLRRYPWLPKRTQTSPILISFQTKNSLFKRISFLNLKGGIGSDFKNVNDSGERESEFASVSPSTSLQVRQTKRDWDFGTQFYICLIKPILHLVKLYLHFETTLSMNQLITLPVPKRNQSPLST